MFRMHKRAAAWTKGLKPSSSQPIKTMLDFYYLFLLVGLAKNRREPFEGKEFMKEWASDLREYKDMYVGLLLVMDFHNSGFEVNKETKEIVKNRLSEAIDSGSSTHLTNNAMELMNEYAYGGYLVIEEKIGKQSSQVHFLNWYANEMLQDAFNSSR